MHDTNPRPKKKKTKTTDQSLLYYERFHHSAAMAIGMFIEEMMTATLLPLAQQYVQYCRRHHQHPENQDGILWTLPPEEAVMKLYDDSITSRGSNGNIHVRDSLLSSSSSLLSTRIPTRSCVSGAMGTSILNQPSISDHTRMAYHNWCRTTMTSHSTNTTKNNSKIQQQWIEKDASFFQLLIQNIPSRTTMKTADTLAIPASQRPIVTSINPIPIDDIDTTDHTDNEI